MGNVNIAIVTPCTLTYLGVKLLLEDLPSATVCHIPDASLLAHDNSDHFDVLVTDSEVCMSHLQFFLPRRSKTIVITSAPHLQPAFDFIDCTKSAGQISERLIAFIDRLRTSDSPQSELSQREIEVLTLVASGKINKEIADALQISINTVLTHRKNISAKLGIKSVSGLSVYAMMNGYLK
ncbi:MAG: response regulator transcription factor [Muribaculaceae bacterium]